jgi:hypothetical protein
MSRTNQQSPNLADARASTYGSSDENDYYVLKSYKTFVTLTSDDDTSTQTRKGIF